MPVHSRQRGVTLVELMVTLAVAAVLLSIAVPSFKNILLSNRLDSVANGIVSAIQVARMEAVKRNAPTQLCSNSASANTNDTLGGSCGTESAAVWALNGTTADQVLAGTATLAPSFQFDGDLVALRFNAQGVARRAGAVVPYGDVVVDICTSRMDSNNHRRITMTGGSILATTTTSGACPST